MQTTAAETQPRTAETEQPAPRAYYSATELADLMTAAREATKDARAKAHGASLPESHYRDVAVYWRQVERELRAAGHPDQAMVAGATAETWEARLARKQRTTKV